MNLFELTTEQLELERMMDTFAAENEGDITDFPLNDEFERLEGERATKLLNIGAWIKSLRATEAAHKAEQKRQGERAKVLGNKADRLESLISCHLANGEKLNDTRCALSFRRSESVVIDVPTESLPKDFVIESTSTAPDKKAIKAHIKDVGKWEFAHIQENFNLQIK